MLKETLQTSGVTVWSCAPVPSVATVPLKPPLSSLNDGQTINVCSCMFVHEQTQHTEACMGYVHLCMYMHVCVHMSVD